MSRLRLCVRRVAHSYLVFSGYDSTRLVSLSLLVSRVSSYVCSAGPQLIQRPVLVSWLDVGYVEDAFQLGCTTLHPSWSHVVGHAQNSITMYNQCCALPQCVNICTSLLPSASYVTAKIRPVFLGRISKGHERESGT